jgi:hypothetical protein
LRSVTILSDKIQFIETDIPFDGDLKDKYLSGRTGTYTHQTPTGMVTAQRGKETLGYLEAVVWTKQ